MAFDKDESNKTRLRGTLSQRAALSHKREGAGKEHTAGKGRHYWSDNFRPNEIADTIRCIYGEYAVQELDDSNGELMESTLPYYPIIEHYHGGLKKGALCSAGPFHMNRNKRSPCHGCDIFWHDFAERQADSQRLGRKVDAPKRVSKSNKYVLTILDPGEFFETEQLDYRTGQVKLNREGKPWMEWRKLRYANDPAAAGRKIKRGVVMPWAMSKTDFDMLTAYSDSNIGMCCAGCGTWGHAMQPMLQTLRYSCQSCNNTLIDMQTSTMAPNQIAELVKLPMPCPHCQTRNFAVEVISCPTCVQRGTTPRRASLWDVDIQVKIVKKTDDPNKHTLLISGYTAPMPIDPQFAELAKPLDLANIFKPTSLEEQAVLWGVSQASADVQHTQPYTR